MGHPEWSEGFLGREEKGGRRARGVPGPMGLVSVAA